MIALAFIAIFIYLLYKLAANYDATANLPEVFVVFDLETTGLYPGRHEILEIAAVKYTKAGRTYQSFQRLVKPSKKIPQAATAIHGITQELVNREGVPLDEALHEFIDFIGDHPIVAYNLQFDMGFLKAALDKHQLKLKNKRSCALKKARRAFRDLDSYKLANVASYLGCKTDGTHRALKDSELALAVYLDAMSELA
jgi:DNA polymerase III epsilon subunit family exonuclease